MSKYGECFICKQEITQEEVSKGIVVMLKTPKDGSRSHAHTTHPGVQQEYDSQLGIKKI